MSGILAASIRNADKTKVPALPHVSVLLLNWNGWRDTIECLESVFRLDYPRLSVVLCDNASSDGSVDRFREWANGQRVFDLETPNSLRHLIEPPIPKPVPLQELSREQAENGMGDVPLGSLILIHNRENLGFAGGNNVGLRYLASRAATKYVWVLNNDIVVAADSLTKLVTCAESASDIGGVGGTLFWYSDPDRVQAAGGGRFSPWRGMSEPAKRVKYRWLENGVQTPALDYLSGGCMLCPVAQLGRVGFIDESYFMYGEDVDYSFRIRRAGLRLSYAPDAFVWHKGGAAVPHRGARHDYYIVRNSLQLARKFYPRMFPFAAAYIAIRCVLPKIAHGQVGRLAVLRRAFGDFRAGIVGPATGLPGEAS